jgi:FMN phosphatase YigB (HAD superfamily)
VISTVRSEVARNIEAVCFDCWGTLLVESNGDAIHRRRVEHLRDCAAEYGSPVATQAARVALDRAWHRHWDCWVGGEPSSAVDIAQHALRALGVDQTGATADLVDRLATTVGSDDVRAGPGARRMLENLSRAGLRLALVCDTGFTTGDGVRRLLDANGLLAWLEVQAFSDETGVAKPHPRIFQHALSAIGPVPQRAMHVGDLRRTDVAGARALGMKTVRIRWAHDDTSDFPEADAVVDSHDDLAALFGFGRQRAEQEKP